MNFLVYLYLVYFVESLFFGNLLVDFVCGNFEESFLFDVVVGIYMY